MMNYKLALSLLGVVTDVTTASFQDTGLSVTQLERITQDAPFRATDRNSVQDGLRKVIYSTLDAVALSNIPLPAEYIAAVIVKVVSPVNYMVAAMWMADIRVTAQDTEQMVLQAKEQNVTGQQLFALICKMVHNSPVTRIQVVDGVPRDEA